VYKDIPGWMHQKDVEAMEVLASNVLEDGLIVEVGSWMGQSTQVWSLNTRGRVIAIDKWEWMPKEYDGPAKSLVDLKSDPFEQFLGFTSHLNNVTPLRRNSSGGQWCEQLADLVFIDAMHQNPWVREDIIYWESKVKPGGVICGDDFSPAFPAVMQEAIACADRFGVQLERLGHKLWLVRMPVN